MGLTYQDRPEFANYRYLAGVDEAGRGPWAGPVVAAAVIMPPGYHHETIDDSKKLTARQRETLYEVIKRDALAIGVAFVDAATIDAINILAATRQAMREALKQLTPAPDFVLLDAVTLPELGSKQQGLIRGDGLALPIAAASIIAKVTRDRYMMELHRAHPEYRFDRHKGYGTKFHRDMITKYGPLPGIHRMSFKPLKIFQIR